MDTPSPAKSILVVDDDGLTRHALTLALESAGYTVHQASNGREAFRVLRTSPPPSAILLDIVMPEMTGWEFLRERDANRAPSWPTSPSSSSPPPVRSYPHWPPHEGW